MSKKKDKRAKKLGRDMFWLGMLNEGIAINRELQRIAYNKGNGDLYWDNYAGTDEEQIVEGGAGGVAVEAMDFGYN